MINLYIRKQGVGAGAETDKKRTKHFSTLLFNFDCIRDNKDIEIPRSWRVCKVCRGAKVIKLGIPPPPHGN